jgi:hypothetical protein
MKRLIICFLILILAGPAITHAQSGDQEQQNPPPYRDVEDGQVLKLVAYILTPVGMALEWGVMRPLHYLSTQTSAAPLLSGDKGTPFFTENNNAKQVPPGTFASPAVNLTNNLQASSNRVVIPSAPLGSGPTPAETIPPTKPLTTGTQPALQ